MATVINVPRDIRTDIIGEGLGKAAEKHQRRQRLKKLADALSKGDLSDDDFLAALAEADTDPKDLGTIAASLRRSATTKAPRTRTVYFPDGSSLDLKIPSTAPPVNTIEDLSRFTGRADILKGGSLTNPNLSKPTETERSITDRLESLGAENNALNRSRLRKRDQAVADAHKIITRQLGKAEGGLFSIPEEQGARFSNSIVMAEELVDKAFSSGEDIPSGSVAARSALQQQTAKVQAQEGAETAIGLNPKEPEDTEGFFDKLLKGSHTIGPFKGGETSPVSEPEDTALKPLEPPTILQRESVIINAPDGTKVSVPKLLWTQGEPMEIVNHVMQTTGLPYGIVVQMLKEADEAGQENPGGL